jgi:hypothetical protein
MYFLIRTAFWLAVVIFLIPVPEDEGAQVAAPGIEPIGAFEAVGAAQATLDDMSGFCARNPDVCDIGGRVATTFALKARTGALWVYSALDSQLGGTGEPPVAPATNAPTNADLRPGWSHTAVETDI